MKSSLMLILLAGLIAGCSPKTKTTVKVSPSDSTSGEATQKKADPKLDSAMTTQTAATYPMVVTSVKFERRRPSIAPKFRKDASWTLSTAGENMDALFDQTMVNDEVSLRTFVALLMSTIGGNETDKITFTKIDKKLADRPKPTGGAVEEITFYGPKGKLFSTSPSNHNYSGPHLQQLIDRVIKEGTRTESAPTDTK